MTSIKIDLNDLNPRLRPRARKRDASQIKPGSSHKGFFCYSEYVIANLNSLGKVRLAETYTTTINSFKRFRCGKDIPLCKIDAYLMQSYEAWLKDNGVCPNSSSFYIRNIRAIYNRAVDKGIIEQRFPFKYVYTGVDKTVKRGVPLRIIKQIKELDLENNLSLDFARDMFLFSFYTRGMSFIDMSFLKKRDLNGKILSYRRRKTSQQLFIKWESCMQEIVDKYHSEETDYLLPIIRNIDIAERKQYLYSAHNINRNLKKIGNMLELPLPLTMYVARHTWASIARSKNIPLSVISEGMGHDSESTTKIYLSSLDNNAIDKANRMIIKLLL